MNKNFKIEICANSLASVSEAQIGGADRVELCDNLSEGGTTPSAATIYYAVKNFDIDVNVLIRPRSGDFLYTDDEFKLIKKDIEIAKDFGANGVVCGLLLKDGNIDFKRTQEIVKLAYPMEFTFHRAFDMCLHPLESIDELVNIGVKRILTSGQKQKAIDGVNMIASMVEKSDSRIIIMPGAGINEKNVLEIKNRTAAIEFHLSAQNFINSKMEYFNNNLSMGGGNPQEEYKIRQSDSKRIKKIISSLK